jgi:2-polyprenyl-3-methyl-5-hydroxy-6-metoxy-1,4-benzoquinol methylase
LRYLSKAADEAARFYDKVYIRDVESINIDYAEYLDFVICNDVIEQLRDPWIAIGNMDKWVKKGGHILASIPNIRYWAILRDLIFFGAWEYVDAGILDNTHQCYLI